jgi:L-fuconolactonase
LTVDRRDFLAVGVGDLLATTSQADVTPRPEIIDPHTHFYDPSRPEGVPLPGKDDKALYRPVVPDEYQKLARPLGVVGTVVTTTGRSGTRPACTTGCWPTSGWPRP